MATVLAVLFTCLLASSTALNDHQLELKKHYEHLSYIANFPCQLPQPKVIPVNRLFSESQSRGKAYFPDLTVLYRCGSCTGVCTSEHKCAPKLTELVILPFKATFLESTDTHKKGSWIMEHHELLNHVECHCVHESHDIEDKSLPSSNVTGGSESGSEFIGSNYGGSSGSNFNKYTINRNNGEENSIQPVSSKEVNKEITGPDYFWQLCRKIGEENTVQPITSKEVNKETTTPDYL